MGKLRHSHNRLELIADKVEKQSPRARASTKGMDPKSFELNMVRHTELMPTQKFDIPMTRAQEVGWLISNPVRARTIRDLGMTRDYSNSAETQAAEASTVGGHSTRKSKSTSSLPKPWPHIPAGPAHPQCALMNQRPSKWHHPKSFCPITKYADCYHATMRHSPFNQKAAR